MKRRTLLLGAGALALSQGLTGCDSFGERRLQILSLAGAVPAQLLELFRKTNSELIKIQELTTPQALFNRLRQFQEPSNGGWRLPWSSSPQPADLVSLGDDWLAAAIEKKLIQPLDLRRIPNWSNLSPAWQQIGQDAEGQTWGVPFRWGSTVIAYRQDQLKTPLTDWSDLWQPTLRHRLTLPDSPREVIGLVLKSLGASYNTPDLGSVNELKAQLQTLHSQVLTYSSDTYLQPLLEADSWAAVGWSTDLLLAARRDPQIQVVLPRSGTALWTDLWVRPRAAPGSAPLDPEPWIDFCLNPTAAAQTTTFSNGTSPIPLAADSADAALPSELRNPDILLPTPAILERSERLLPLAKDTADQYNALWREIRRAAADHR